MTFNELYNLLTEGKFVNIDGAATAAARKRNREKPQDTSKISDLDSAAKRINSMFHRYGFSVKNYALLMHLLQKDTSSQILFRGHKTIDPFIKDIDTKSPRDTVYWAKDPENARIFAQSTSTGGTRGRSFQTILHKIFGNYDVGYMSIAYPKYPNSVIWYDDFGVETEIDFNNEYRQKTGKGFNHDADKDNIEKQARAGVGVRHYNSQRIKDSNRHAKGDSSSWGYNRGGPDEDNYSGQSKLDTFKKTETVLAPHEVTKLKTYIIKIGGFQRNPENYQGYYLLNLDTVKQKDPELYRVLLWDRLS